MLYSTATRSLSNNEIKCSTQNPLNKDRSLAMPVAGSKKAANKGREHPQVQGQHLASSSAAVGKDRG